MKNPIPLLLCLLVCTLYSCFVIGQKSVVLQLIDAPPTLLESENGTFTFVLSNQSDEDAFNVSVNFTLNQNFQILAETATTTNGTFQSGWNIDTLKASTSDTLNFESIGLGYVRFIAETTSDDNLLITRCFNSDCFPEDNTKCFYTNCTLEEDEVLYPTEYAQLEFTKVDCFPTGSIGCGAKYNITFKNPSNVSSAPTKLFLQAEIGEVEAFYEQSGFTLIVPPIPANDSLIFTADFGECIENRPFASVNSLRLGLTPSDQLIEFLSGSPTVDIALLDAVTDLSYCTYNNTADIAVRVESDSVIFPNNTTSYQVFVTNNGNETAEFVQITYGKSIFSFSGDIIAYDATSEYEESTISQDEESRSRFLDYDEYWTVRNLEPGETAVLNATATVQEFVGIFNTDIFVNDNSFLDDPSLENNQTSIEFTRPTFVDLELSVVTNNSDIKQWESGIFTYILENKSNTDATGVEVRLYYNNDVVPVGGAAINASTGNYATVPDNEFIFIGLWKNIDIPAGSSASLELELFSKVPELSFCAEITVVDQEDSDSMPSVSACTLEEDDEAQFSSGIENCNFFKTYSSFDALTDEVGIIENEEQYSIQSNEIEVTIDKQGNLLSSEAIIPEPNPTFSVNITGNEVQFTKISPEGDTLFNEIFTVDYDGADAIVNNSPVFTVSDGLVFGGFIVDFDSNQSFRGFVIKTDLNGQSPQFITVDDIDDTLGFGRVLEDSQGNLYPYWVGAGNFSISRISVDFSSAWASQFTSDTPSTDLEDIQLSVDEQKIYIAVTDNLRAIVYAFDTSSGETVAGGFELADWIPITGPFQLYRSNGLLTLENGNLLFANRFFGNENEDRFDYSLFNSDGQLIWRQSIEGIALTLRPVTQTSDNGFLFVNRLDQSAREIERLQILKTNEVGVQLPNCNPFEADTSIDLELSISSENTNVPIWTSTSFTLTLVNNGPDDATNVEVQLPIDVDRFVEVGESAPIFSKGTYAQGIWRDLDLAAGESATLQIEIFNKSEVLELFAQVTKTDQADIDSSPSNAVCCVASEDDEAIFISEDAPESRLSIINNIQAYPNPTNHTLFLEGIKGTNLNYQIIDVLGKVKEERVLINQQIEVHHLPKGTYFLSIQTKEGTILRFVKQ